MHVHTRASAADKSFSSRARDKHTHTRCSHNSREVNERVKISREPANVLESLVKKKAEEGAEKFQRVEIPADKSAARDNGGGERFPREGIRRNSWRASRG